MADGGHSLAEAADREIERLSSQIVGWRRRIHMYPETAHEEVETARLVVETLRAFGWTEIQSGLAGHGVVAVLRGTKPAASADEKERCIAFRADMDALWLEEKTGAPYQSQVPGKMHACGHDNHVAILLGLAAVLSRFRSAWRGIVKLIFEPAEETGEGASAMIDAGALRQPDVEFLINLAVGTSIGEGQVRLIEGVSMPRIDRFSLEIEGESSHGGEPHRGIDAIVLAAEIVQALQRVISRQTAPSDPVILNIYQINGGRPDGVISDHVKMIGGLRGFSESAMEGAFRAMRRAVEGVVASYGGKASLQHHLQCPPGYHDPAVTRLVYEAAVDAAGVACVTLENRPDWGGDTFAYYTRQVPGAFVWFGVRNEARQMTVPVHHPRFDVNDEVVLPLAVRVGSRVVWRTLA